MYNFNLPDIGEGLHEAEILKWFVQTGQSIKENEPLVELQTDKAVVEITAPVSGTIMQLGGQEGEVITVGNLLCQFTSSDSTPTSTTHLDSTPSEKSESSNLKSIGKVKAAPSVRKLARQANLNIEEIIGTGPGGRVLHADVQKVMIAEKPIDTVKVSSEEPEIIPIKGLRKAIFENMEKSISKAVLCTGMEKINVTKLVKFKEEYQSLEELKNRKLTYLPFILKAVTHSLLKNKHFNAKVDEENKTLITYPYVHLGVAVATENGLLVPVIKHAEQKSILEIADELDSLLEKVKNKNITAAELKGSTFTVSSTGREGGTFATPIPNYPEVAILGVHKILKEPVVVNDEIVIGHTMTMSCTFDHRVLDGEPVSRFMQDIAKYLEQPLRFIN